MMFAEWSHWHSAS